ncbi:cytidine deaminase [Candidatus Bathyarchaeota archaeon]|nr:cytidine deaminase [Candidatus Bathyarchaeota archaeon]MCK4481958.1 cytidine deaminase [Candidatus Bathyarchaeota archaeon]
MDEVGENEKRLLEAALKAMDNAYVLWGCKVGAAILAEDSKIYGGCNVESWISGVGICAERCAINHAVLHGNRKVKKIAIVVDANSQCEPRPCGACLQYIFDFAENSKIEIVMAKERKDGILFETAKVKTLEELLPYPFRK